MTTRRMNESPAEDDGSVRKTVVKRGASSRLPLPAALALAMEQEPSCAGCLDKLASSTWAHWQTRHWELRGHFLVYYKPPSATDGLIAPGLLLGAIDLRHISAVSLSFLHQSQKQELVLSSRSRDFRLRASDATHARSGAEAPSITSWEKHIRRSRDELSYAGGDSRQQLDTVWPSGDAEVILADIYDGENRGAVASAANPLSAAAATSVLAPKPKSVTMDGTELQNMGAAGQDDGAGSIQAAEKNAPGNSVSILPPNLDRALVLVGARRGTGKCAGVTMWMKRIAIIALFLIVGTLDLSLLIPSVGNASEMNEGPKRYIFEVMNATDGFSCANSLAYERDGTVPCIALAAYLGRWPAYCLCSLIVYVWLLKNADLSNFLLTHRVRMAKNVDKFAKVCLAFQFFMLMHLGLFYGLGWSTNVKSFGECAYNYGAFEFGIMFPKL